MSEGRRIFDPNAGDATLVHTSEGQSPCNTEYQSELEAYFAERDIARLMRERTSVCG
jgi:hypothetical protein